MVTNNGGDHLRKRRRIIIVVLISCLFGGCTSIRENKKEELIVLSTSKQYDENYGTYDPGYDINDNPMIQLGIDQLNIKIEYQILGTSYEDYINKIRLALSGANELPDIIPVYDQGLLAEMIDSGQVKEITEIVENKMPERLKPIYDRYSETFLPVEREGKIYGMAISPALAETQVLFIRQDWLDKLNLKPPTNIEEFETVMKAFTTQDPDGNGQNDTYGFSYSGNGIYSTGWLGDPAMLFSSMSGKFIPGNWEEAPNGQLMYGSLHTGNKEALKKFSEWHQKGWTIPDAALINDWAAFEQFRKGKSGMVVGRSSYILDAQEVSNVDPKAEVRAYSVIKQANGEQTYQRAEVNDGWFLFNKEFEDFDAFFKYYDWLYDIAFGTGSFQYGYLENFDYDVIGDQVVFEPEKFSPVKESPIFNPSKAIFTKNAPKIDSMKPYVDILNGKQPKTPMEQKAQALMKERKELITPYQIAFEARDSSSENKFKGPQTVTMRKKWYKLQLLEMEAYTDIIYGEAPLSSFDDFTETWYAEGGKEITREVNEWYQSAYRKLPESSEE